MNCEYTEACGLCGKHVPGAGTTESPTLFLVGEAPGRDEDRAGIPFVGKSGQELDMYLRRYARVSRENCYITNVVKCRPRNNRTPKPHEARLCGALYLEDELEQIQPDIVVTLGLTALKWFTGKRSMRREHGIVQYARNTLLVPCYHPAHGVHSPKIMKQLISDFRTVRRVLRGTYTAPTHEQVHEYKMVHNDSSNRH